MSSLTSSSGERSELQKSIHPSELLVLSDLHSDEGALAGSKRNDASLHFLLEL